MVHVIDQLQSHFSGRIAPWLWRQKRRVLRGLIADVIANRKTKPKPINERVAPLLTLAFGVNSICFVAYLGAIVAIPVDMDHAFRALSWALEYSFFSLAILLFIEYERRTHDDFSSATLRFFVIVAQLSLVVQVVTAAHAVVAVGTRFTDENFKDNRGVMLARERVQCEQRRLEEVESIAKDIKDADQAVAHCEHQLDAHVFAIRLAQEKGELSHKKADQLRKIAWQFCLPYVNAYDDHRLRMELAYVKSCEQDLSQPSD